MARHSAVIESREFANVAMTETPGTVMITTFTAWFLVVGYLASCLFVVGGLLLVLLGPWELLVWIVKADWGTTHGAGPLAGILMCIVGVVLGAVAAAFAAPPEEVRPDAADARPATGSETHSLFAVHTELPKK